jgi:hypothetical protein
MTTHKDEQHQEQHGGRSHPQAPEGHKPPDPAQHEQAEAAPASKQPEAKPGHIVGDAPPKPEGDAA